MKVTLDGVLVGLAIVVAFSYLLSRYIQKRRRKTPGCGRTCGCSFGKDGLRANVRKDQN